MSDDRRGGTQCDPRVARSRATVLAATAELLTEVGFQGVSIEAVAARSGVAKTTIYRHWPTRARLLMAAFTQLGGPCPDPNTGDVREDLLVLARDLAHQLQTAPWAQVLPSLAAEARREPELEVLHRQFLGECHSPLVGVVDRAILRDQLPEEIDRPVFRAMIAGPLFYRAFVSFEPLDEPDLAERIVDAALAAVRSPVTAG